VNQLLGTLAPDEIERAGRFRFERDRRRFIVGRGVLRAILGRYLAVEPRLISFLYGKRGKPRLADEFDIPALQFNLAHSGELALYAFGLGRRIGIDVEYVRPLSDAEEISARFFSSRENDALRALPQDQRLAAFYRCWTRKEAYLKAIGDGLARPLDQFTVSLSPGETAKLFEISDPNESARWSFRALVPKAGYMAAVVTEGVDWCLECWQWV
jgi:4'-phosphopantetheinyl transferase